MPDAVVDLSGPVPTLGPQAHGRFQDCLRAATTDRSRWTEPARFGDPLLREQLAARFGRSADHVCITAGVRSAALAYGRRFNDVLLEQPSYEGVIPALGSAGARLRRLSWDAMYTASCSPATLLWLTSPYRNPDGVSLTSEQYVRLAGIRAASGATVVINRTYGLARLDTTEPPGTMDLVGGFHKIAGIGARIGFVISDTFGQHAVTDLAACSPSAVWQHAWALFLAEGSFDEATRHLYSSVGNATRAFLTGIGMSAVRSPGSPHLVLECPPNRTETMWQHEFAAAGVAVSPGSAFGATSDCVRLSFFGVSEQDAAVAAERTVRAGLLNVPQATGW